MDSKSQHGWQLRLLLSLEESGRTRTRLLVTEVLAGIITDIVNVIPVKVNGRDRSTTAYKYPAPVAAVSSTSAFGIIQDAMQKKCFLDDEGTFRFTQSQRSSRQTGSIDHSILFGRKLIFIPLANCPPPPAMAKRWRASKSAWLGLERSAIRPPLLLRPHLPPATAENDIAVLKCRLPQTREATIARRCTSMLYGTGIMPPR